MVVGSRVVTRRGKTGVVTEVLDGGFLMVKFGSYTPIKLSVGSVVTEDAYERMLAGGRVNAAHTRLNGRL